MQCKELTHWKRLWCWERLKAKGEGTAEDGMVRYHHRLNGYEQIPGDSGGQRSLECCSPWGHKSQTWPSTWATMNIKRFYPRQVVPMVKNSLASAEDVRDPGSIPRSGRSPGVGNGKPTPLFFPGESLGQRSLAGYSSWGHKESNMTEGT